MWLHILPIVTLVFGYVLGYYGHRRIERDIDHTDKSE